MQTVTAMKKHPAFHFAHFFAQRFGEERCLQVAGSLTFTTLLSIVPIAAIALTLISAFPVFSDMSIQIKTFLFSNLVPESSGKILSIYVTQFSENAARLTALGIAFLTLTALTLMLTIDHVFNTIWRISSKRPMLHRILIYWGMLTIGPLLIGGSLSITSWLMGRSAEFIHSPHEIGILFLKVVPVLLTIAALSLLYLIVPNTPVPKHHALLGGAIAGIAFELMKIGFGWYITHFTTYKLIYGAFASIPVFLLWIYLSWLIVLSGALLTASMPLWEQSSWNRKSFPGKRFYDALHILEALYIAQKSGKTLEADRLHRQLKLDFDLVESILHEFSAHGYAKEAAEGGWLLARDADDITLSDIYRLTVFAPGHGRALPGQLDRNIADIIGKEMNIPLKAAFRKD
ncbi:MAG: YihY family inner membrane protein [Burkholderiales bacterium]|nr:YihY family inner membrane protein [Burkholderiales bacterium]